MALQTVRFKESPLWDNRFNAQNHDTWEAIQIIFGRGSQTGKLECLSLNRENEAISLSDFNWFFIRMLAKRGGWIPAGSIEPPNNFRSPTSMAWSGTYGEICGQSVGDDDARNLGAALESILGEIPDEDVIPYPIPQFTWLDAVGLESFLNFQPVEVMSGPNKQIVRTAASFLGRGSLRLLAYRDEWMFSEMQSRKFRDFRPTRHPSTP